VGGVISGGVEFLMSKARGGDAHRGDWNALAVLVYNEKKKG